jgi:hypothetical protein
MREAMERQCESHALLCVQMDNFNCDVFIGVGCLDDNSQTSSTLPLVFQALPVEGYVYVDSVPVNMTPCIGIQELQSVCTQVSHTLRMLTALLVWKLGVGSGVSKRRFLHTSKLCACHCHSDTSVHVFASCKGALREHVC